MENITAAKSIWEKVKAFFRRELVSYIVKRILLFIPTLLITSLLIFIVIQLPPGDYVSYEIDKLMQEGVEVSQAEADALREEYGLDKPVIVQYWMWIRDIIWTGSDTSYYRLYGSHHNWKYSFAYKRNVWDVVMDRLGITVAITLVTMVFQYALAIPVAVYSATHQYSFGDYALSIISFVGNSIPGFILAIVLMYLSYKWTGNAQVGIFTQEMQEIGITWDNLGEFLKRCIIPLVVLGLGGTCGTIRTIRAQMLDELSSAYTLTARAKGVKESTIVWKYCFRGAINPTVTGLGHVLSDLFSGSTVTALVLNLQIQGPVLLEALKSQDMYLAGAIVMVQAVLVEVGILLSDVGLAFLDPRIRFSGGAR